MGMLDFLKHDREDDIDDDDFDDDDFDDEDLDDDFDEASDDIDDDESGKEKPSRRKRLSGFGKKKAEEPDGDTDTEDDLPSVPPVRADRFVDPFSRDYRSELAAQSERAIDSLKKLTEDALEEVRQIAGQAAASEEAPSSEPSAEEGVYYDEDDEDADAEPDTLPKE